MTDDALNQLFDDFENVEGITEPKRPSKAKREPAKSYRSALDEKHTTRHTIAKATGKTAVLAGQYMRRSFTYRPDQLENIELIAQHFGLSQNDLIRWFIDLGVTAVQAGQQPPLTEIVQRKYNPNG